MPAPKNGVAYTFDAFLVDAAARPAFRANPTLAAGDVTVSKDDAAFANITTLPTVTPAAGVAVKTALAAAEVGERTKVRFKDQTVPAEWDEVVYEVLTTAVTVDDLVRSTTPANTLAVSAAGRAESDVKLIEALDPTDQIRDSLVTDATRFAGADIATLMARLSAARAGYLDNLNVGGLVASSAEALAIQNNTRVVRVVPDVIERPDSGTVTYRIELLLYDSVGNMEVPDSAPTIALVNQAGTDLSARLDSATMALVSTGRYRAIYTAAVGDALEQLVWTFSVIEGGATRLYGNASLIVDTSAVDFTAADRAKLDTLHDTRLTAARATNLDNLNATVSSRASQASLDVVDDLLDTEIASLIADTTTLLGRLTAARALLLDNIGTLTVAERAAIADKYLGRSIQGGADGGRTVTSTMRRIRNRNRIVAGVLTTYQEDDVTPDHTAAVTTAAGNPISEVDPA